MTPLTRRATAEYRRATAEQIAAGHRWYWDAHKIAASQAGAHGVTIEIASGVLAALSPRMGWGANVMLAERMLASGGTLETGALPRSLEHARIICSGVPVLDVLRGPKTRAFYLAILTGGESTDAVIDRHAWDMLTGSRLSTPPNLTQYREASEKMTRAAKILGVGVHDVQATTWLTWRTRFWAPTAFGPRPNLGQKEVTA